MVTPSHVIAVFVSPKYAIILGLDERNERQGDDDAGP